jgi:hypothetical protein
MIRMTKCYLCGNNIKKGELKVAYADLSLIDESNTKLYEKALAGKLCVPHHITHEECAENRWDDDSEY